jgi:hypothetical protein
MVAGPALAALMIHVVMTVEHSLRHGGSPAALVCVGERQAGHFPFEVFARPFDAWGYDGQFYYALARNPWQRHDQGIDAPAARHVRVLYPSLCWLASAGQPAILIWIMPLVNLIAIAGLAALGAWFAHYQGMNKWWGLYLPLVASAGIPLVRDLTDVVSTFAICALAAAWLVRGSWWTLALSAGTALFAREQNLAVVLIMMGTALFRGQSKSTAAMAAAVLLWAAWACFLHATYGTSPFLSPQGNLDLPFAGFQFCWQQAIDRLLLACTRFELLSLWSTLNVTAHMVLACYFLVRCLPKVTDHALLATGMLLALVAGPAIYTDPWSYVRVLVWLPLGIWLASVHQQCRWPLLLLAPTALWALFAPTRL